MTNQQDLRERIAALIDEHVIAVSMSDSWLEGQEEAADAILALLSPPDTGLASLVGEVDRLVAGATSLPWQTEDGDSVVKIVSAAGEVLASVCSVPYWKRFSGQDSNNAALIVALVNNWPRLRAALTTGGWLPIDSAPKDGTKVLCWTPEQSVCLYWCKHRGGWFEWADNEFCMFPTHWMPLPNPPSKPDTGG